MPVCVHAHMQMHGPVYECLCVCGLTRCADVPNNGIVGTRSHACLAFIWVLGIQMLVLTLGWQVLYPLSRLPKPKALTLKSSTIPSNSIVSWGPRVQNMSIVGRGSISDPNS